MTPSTPSSPIPHQGEPSLAHIGTHNSVKRDFILTSHEGRTALTDWDIDYFGMAGELARQRMEGRA